MRLVSYTRDLTLSIYSTLRAPEAGQVLAMRGTRPTAAGLPIAVVPTPAEVRVDEPRSNMRVLGKLVSGSEGRDGSVSHLL